MGFFVVAALFPGAVAWSDPFAVNPTRAFASPGWGHILGTDESGRDVYARVVHGAAQSLSIGLAATTLGMGLAVILTLLGLLGGVLGKWVEFGVTRFTEVLFAFPTLVLALLYVALVGPGVGSAIVAVGLSTAPGYARIMRGQALAVSRSGYVAAAKVSGDAAWTRMVRHILPNTLLPLLPMATLGVGQAIVWASALSYLGVGVVPPAAEWGAMLNAGRPYMQIAWWLTVMPGCAIVLCAAAATVLGNGLQRRLRAVG